MDGIQDEDNQEENGSANSRQSVATAMHSDLASSDSASSDSNSSDSGTSDSDNSSSDSPESSKVKESPQEYANLVKKLHKRIANPRKDDNLEPIVEFVKQALCYVKAKSSFYFDCGLLDKQTVIKIAKELGIQKSPLYQESTVSGLDKADKNPESPTYGANGQTVNQSRSQANAENSASEQINNQESAVLDSARSPSLSEQLYLSSSEECSEKPVTMKKPTTNHVFKCNQCSMKFIEKADLKFHVNQHLCRKLKQTKAKPTKEQIQYDEVDTSESSDLENVDENQESPSNDQSINVLDVKLIQKFPCEHCGRKFSSKTAQDNHKNHCKENDANLYCDICDKKFSRVDTAKKHKSKHWLSGKKDKYRCLQCNIQCTTANSKSNHDTRRKNGIVFQCDCGQKFCYEHHLRKHQESKKRNKNAGHGRSHYIPSSRNLTFRIKETRMREKKGAKDTTVEMATKESSPPDGPSVSPARKYPDMPTF